MVKRIFLILLIICSSCLASQLTTYNKEENEQCNECTYECLFEKPYDTQEFQCRIASYDCEENYEQFNFFSVIFCSLDGYTGVFVPIAIIIIFLIFRFISMTVEEYVTESITFLSKYMKLSDQLAAVTLIALANGAGDVITAIVASGAEGGVSYNVGSLFGAGFFVGAMTICLTIRSSSTIIIVTKSTIYRDIGLYILSTIVIIIFAATNYIYWYSAVILLLIYVALVIIVYFQGKMKRKRSISSQQSEVQSIDQMQQSLISKKSNYSDIIMQQPPTDFENPKPLSPALKKFQQAGRKVLAQVSVIYAFTLKEKKQLVKKSIERQLTIQGSGEEQEPEEEEVPWAEKTLVQKIMFTIDFPFSYLLKITIPPAKEEEFDKILCISWPFPGIIFIFWGTGFLDDYLIYVGLPIAFVIQLIFYYTQKDLKENEAPRYYIFISIIALLCGLLWTYIACSMLVDILGAFIVIFRLNQTFMGLTILGIGNALPDSLTTIQLAKLGYAQMGITGSYAGQLFGLLIGFGIAQLKTTLVSGQPQPFDLFSKPEQNLLSILVMVFFLFSLILTSVLVLKNKQKFTKNLGNILGIIYVVFFLLAIIIQVLYLADVIEE